MIIRRAASLLLGLFVTLIAVVGVPVAASAATWAGSDGAAGPQPAGSRPALADTGYDFTPMLITAAVFLVIAGVAVLVAKYALARSSHS